MQNPNRDGLIDELYHDNYTAVLSVCARILRRREDAADAAQQVFLIAVESLDLTLSRDPARAWLLTVARNHCVDVLRRRKRLGEALVRLGPDGGRATDLETAVADRDFIRVVFKQLSKRERQALWHSAVESRPLGDIAGRLRLNYMAAAQMVHRARRHAVEIAGRVAVVVGVFQLGRQRARGGLALAATRLAAVAAVPVILVSLQSSSPTPKAPATLSPAVSSSQPTTVTAPNLPGAAFPSPSGGGQGGGLPATLPGSTGTLNSAIGTLRQLLRPLPSVPPVVGQPPVLPSLPPP